MTSKSAYYVELSERPNIHLELRPLNDSNRGIKIIEIEKSKETAPGYKNIRCPAKVISINGERVLKYTFNSCKRILNNCQLPMRLRLENVDGRRLSNSSSTNMNITETPEVMENDNYYDYNISNNQRNRNKNRVPSHMCRGGSYSSKRTSNGYTAYRSTSNNFQNRGLVHQNSSGSQRRNHSRNTSISSDTNQSIFSIEAKECQVCSKRLKEHKQHRCRRCGNVVCSKCSKNKRLEPGYLKLVRVCNACKIRDEFTVNVEKKPLRVLISPLHDMQTDIGGILIREVKDGGGIRDCERLKKVRLKQCVIFAINDVNIELMAYAESYEKLRLTQCPFSLSLKKWNKNTKTSVKSALEAEKRDREEMELDAAEEAERQKLSKKLKKKSRKKSYLHTSNSSNEYLTNTLSPVPKLSTVVSGRAYSPAHHQRQDTGSSVHSYGSATDDGISPSCKTPMNQFDRDRTGNLFGDNTDISRYNGTLDIEDHPAMEYIQQAMESEKNNELENAKVLYDKGLKPLRETLLAIDNHKIQRKWTKTINDFEIQLLRIKRKLKLRRKIKRSGGQHKRSATMAVKMKKTNTNSAEYTSDIKNPSQNNGETKKSKSEIKADEQDQAFRIRLEADIIDEKPNVSFKDVMGLANVKLAIYETVILPQKRPELFTGLRAPSKGLLLFGPPGNGKTMIAKCVASEINSTFFSISASSITSKFVGDAERIMRTLFGLAREKAPSIIFIDEIDSLLTARGGKNEAESSRRIKTEFLVQFDGVHSATDMKASILVIGATNLPDQLDDAVLRRFSKRILVPHPEYETRFGLIRNLMRDEPHIMVLADFQKIAKATERYSCSDIAHLCRDAALGPLREMGASLMEEEVDFDAIPKTNLAHFEASLRNIRSSLSKESLGYYRTWDKKFGSKFHLTSSDLPVFLQPHPFVDLS